MPICFSRLVIPLLALTLWSSASLLLAQDASTPPPAAAEDSYQAQRKFAITLFDQNKHLEALPVLESLAKQNPNDADVIFAWGVCLLDHSSTLPDQEAERLETVRARQLLVRAQELGKKSSLLLNLLEILPENGSSGFSTSSASDAAMRAGEAAFAKNDYEEAIKQYSRALDLTPGQYYAALFIGDSYFSKKDFSNAVIWYDRAIALDPNIETAYRYEADMLIKSGEMEEARKRSIQAVVANPYTQITWRALNYWATSNKVALAQPKIKVPGSAERKDDMHINITIDPKDADGTSGAWLAYQISRASWMGDEFKKHFPNEKQYRHSLLEESDALRLAATVLTAKDNMKKYGKEYQKNLDVSLLLKLYDAKMIEPFVLISAPDRDIALNDYAPYREQHRDQLEAYLSQFVVPPTPASKN